MHLASIAVRDFQSYREPGFVTIDPRLGRNNVGKSALLRALRFAVEGQEGAGPDFGVTYTWALTADELLAGVLPPGSESQPLEEWLRSSDEHTVSASFARANAEPVVGGTAGNLGLTQLELPALNAVAVGGPNTQLGWTSGPFANSAGVISNFDAFFRQLLGKVSYVTPRRIEQGPRPLNAQRELAPDARNLAEVLLFFQLNYPNTLFSGLIAFMSEAFPEIETITLDRDGYRAHLWSGSDLVWWTQGYERKAGALNAIRIAKASYNAPVYDRTLQQTG